MHSSHGNLEEACLCTPGFSDIDFAGPLSLWWLLWIRSPRNMHVDMHAIRGSLWILWYLSVDPRNCFRVRDPEEHILYPAAGLLQIMWMPVMSWARESYCVSELCKILMCLLSPFRGSSQKMLHHLGLVPFFTAVPKRKCLGFSVFTGSRACCNLAIFFGVVTTLQCKNPSVLCGSSADFICTSGTPIDLTHF